MGKATHGEASDMNFVRKRKRGQSHKVRRTWFSDEGYRIIWRKEVYGVRVPARFQACVRVLVPYSDGQLRPMWDFVNRNRRLLKRLRAAEEECEKHKRLWTKACQAAGIRALKELFGGRLPMGLPLWARKKLDRRLYAILTDGRPARQRDEEDEPCTVSLSPASDAPGPGGPARTSESSASPTEAVSETLAPVLPAEGKERSTTPEPRRARSKATSADEPSAAPPVEAAATGQKTRAAKRTAKRSMRTRQKSRSTIASPGSDAKRSRGSRKKPVLCEG